MSCNTRNFHQESFRIKHEDEKFITRLLSKESSKSDPSFRVYYGDVPSAVPFTWETAPGTPKHKYYDDYVPPLTPPPSYYTNNLGKCSKQHYSRSKILILHTLLRRMKVQYLAKSDHSPAPSSSYSSMSSLSCRSSFDQSSRTSDQTMTKAAYDHRRRRFSSLGSCFRIGKDNVRDRIKVGYLKKAVLSIVGRGSA